MGAPALTDTQRAVPNVAPLTGDATVAKDADDDGNEVPRGTAGEVLVKGEHIMVEYWNRPEATAETIKNGWLHTGDVAIMDEEGFVSIQDRIKDMIISGGENVYPAEIEGVCV